MRKANIAPALESWLKDEAEKRVLTLQGVYKERDVNGSRELRQDVIMWHENGEYHIGMRTIINGHEWYKTTNIHTEIALNILGEFEFRAINGIPQDFKKWVEQILEASNSVQTREEHFWMFR